MSDFINQLLEEDKIYTHRVSVVLPPEAAFNKIIYIPEELTIDEAIDNLRFNKKENKFGGYDYLQNFLKEQNIKVEGNKEPFAADKVGEVNLESKEYLDAKRINESIKIEPVDSDMTQAISKTNERIDNLIGAENKEQNNGNLVSANKPNVTDAKLKIAAAPLPFVKVIKNNQLSTSPKSYNGLPPEIAAMIS